MKGNRMDKIITKEYPANLLVYYGCITAYFERLSFVIFEFLKLEEPSICRKILSEISFEKLKQLMNEKIKKGEILKGDLKKEYKNIYKRIEYFQIERNDIIHSIPIKSYSDNNIKYRYNKREIEKKGIDALKKEDLDSHNDFCVELIKFVKTLQDFLLEYSVRTKISN